MKLVQTSMLSGRFLCWVSWGAASAVAAKLAVEKYKDEPLEFLNCDTSKNEHPDNARFRKDVEQWIGREVKVLKSKAFSTVEEVFESRKYMSGIWRRFVSCMPPMWKSSKGKTMTLPTALKIHSAFGAIRERAYLIGDHEIIRICNETIDDTYFQLREAEKDAANLHTLPELKPTNAVLADAPRH